MTDREVKRNRSRVFASLAALGRDHSSTSSTSSSTISNSGTKKTSVTHAMNTAFGSASASASASASSGSGVLKIPPYKGADGKTISYGSGKSSARHLLHYHYGAQAFSEELSRVLPAKYNGTGSSQRAGVDAIFIDGISLFRSMTDEMLTGDKKRAESALAQAFPDPEAAASRSMGVQRLIQAFKNLIEKELNHIRGQLTHDSETDQDDDGGDEKKKNSKGCRVFLVFDNYSQVWMAKAVEQRNRDEKRVHFTDAQVDEALSWIEKDGELPPDYDDLKSSNRRFIMGLIRFCVMSVLDKDHPGNAIGVPKNVQLWIYGHYLTREDFQKLGDGWHDVYSDVRNTPLFISGQHFYPDEDYTCAIGEGDMVIPFLMKQCSDEFPDTRVMLVYSDDTDFLWILMTYLRRFVKKDSTVKNLWKQDVIFRFGAKFTWVVHAGKPWGGTYVNMNRLVDAIDSDPIFAKVNDPSGSVMMSAIAGGNDYVDGFLRVPKVREGIPMYHFMNAFRLAADEIGSLCTFDYHSKGWVVDEKAYRNLVLAAANWSVQFRKWDKTSPVDEINPSDAGDKRVPPDLHFRFQHIQFYLALLNQTGDRDVKEPNLAKYAYGRLDRTKPWTRHNLTRLTDGDKLDKLVDEDEKFWIPESQMPTEVVALDSDSDSDSDAESSCYSDYEKKASDAGTDEKKDESVSASASASSSGSDSDTGKNKKKRTASDREEEEEKSAASSDASASGPESESEAEQLLNQLGSPTQLTQADSDSDDDITDGVPRDDDVLVPATPEVTAASADGTAAVAELDTVMDDAREPIANNEVHIIVEFRSHVQGCEMPGERFEWNLCETGPFVKSRRRLALMQAGLRDVDWLLKGEQPKCSDDDLLIFTVRISNADTMDRIFNAAYGPVDLSEDDMCHAACTVELTNAVNDVMDHIHLYRNLTTRLLRRRTE